MRLVKRAEFLLMPAGTVYAKYIPQFLGSIQVKYTDEQLSRQGWNDSWWYRSFDCIDAESDTIISGRYDQMERDSKLSFPVTASVDRDGYHEGDEVMFMIYEREDIGRIIMALRGDLV